MLSIQWPRILLLMELKLKLWTLIPKWPKEVQNLAKLPKILLCSQMLKIKVLVLLMRDKIYLMTKSSRLKTEIMLRWKQERVNWRHFKNKSRQKTRKNWWSIWWSVLRLLNFQSRHRKKLLKMRESFVKVLPSNLNKKSKIWMTLWWQRKRVCPTKSVLN